LNRPSKTLLSAMALLLGACVAPAESAEDTDSLNGPLTPAPSFAGDTVNGAPFAVDVSYWETPLAQAEMDCFWDSGARHVVVGTQREDITREQLAMAVSRGMTVDAYVYLYWDTDTAAQVKEAFRRVKGFPVGRMWLDIEQNPAGRSAKTLKGLIQKAVGACQADGSASCGIYTGPGFWKTYTGNTTAFASVPLWYAIYNNKTSLSDWSKEAFGGWSAPVAKQFASKPLCGIGGVDWDVMKVSATPTVAVDRSLPPDTGSPPPAPVGLYPADGQVVKWSYAKIMSETIPRATQYDVAVERWNGAAWLAYNTWTNANAFVMFSPATPNSIYRFRVRAEDEHGWGDWSDWSAFDFGTYTGPRPGTSTPPPPPPAPGVPGNLSPDGNPLVTAPSVTLTCSAPTGAAGYEFAIEYQSNGAWATYYTYATTAPSRTFYPVYHGTGYRWHVRAKVNGTFGAFSSYATFQFK